MASPASRNPAAADSSADRSLPSVSSEPENAKGYLPGLTFKRAVVILLVSGVTLRALGVWDNSYLKTAAVAATIGAVVGVYITAKDEKERNLSSLSEVAFLLGGVSAAVAVVYSIA
ncbi:MAG: hypothetical protein KR126chlam6_00971, partial [Candidatus Anoxychlamydiales bacterium]|nr:hypothetical protein [Candidatus Anoxychlamydiales bacterium]